MPNRKGSSDSLGQLARPEEAGPEPESRSRFLCSPASVFVIQMLRVSADSPRGASGDLLLQTWRESLKVVKVEKQREAAQWTDGGWESAGVVLRSAGGAQAQRFITEMSPGLLGIRTRPQLS